MEFKFIDQIYINSIYRRTFMRSLLNIQYQYINKITIHLFPLIIIANTINYHFVTVSVIVLIK